MSDELNVSALAAQICGCTNQPQHLWNCTLIRTYGDERHAAGYQAAIADVVEWLEDSDPQIANEITQRFGRDADE